MIEPDLARFRLPLAASVAVTVLVSMAVTTLEVEDVEEDRD